MLKLHCDASLQHPAKATVIILGNLITVFNILALEPIHQKQAPLVDGVHYKERGTNLKCVNKKIQVLFRGTVVTVYF